MGSVYRKDLIEGPGGNFLPACHVKVCVGSTVPTARTGGPLSQPRKRGRTLIKGANSPRDPRQSRLGAADRQGSSLADGVAVTPRGPSINGDESLVPQPKDIHSPRSPEKSVSTATRSLKCSVLPEFPVAQKGEGKTRAMVGD
jgi:hypothetical protein